MESDLIKSITEAFRKEIEHYQLDRIGFIQTPQAEINFIINHLIIEAEVRKATDPESFRQWRWRVFSAYYEKKGFAAFVKSHIHQPAFTKMVFRLTTSLLSQQRASAPLMTDTDKHLAPTGKTLSWLLSEEHFVELYALHFQENIEIGNTDQLVSHCRKIIQIFPLTTTDILTFLADNNRACWENMCIHLKRLTESVTKVVFRPYKYDTSQDIWTDTCLALKRAIENGKLPLDAKAQEVNAFAIGIIRNKIKAFFRIQKKEGWLLIENWEQDPSLQCNEDDYSEMKNDYSIQESQELANIDTDDENKFRTALACALLSKDDPIHQQLPKGMEDKLKILVAHCVEKLSYEEIALERNSRLSSKELKKETDRLRQEVARVKIKIKEIFKKLS